MTDNRWQKIESIYHAALESTGSDRQAFLDHACGGDRELKREVESLLDHRQGVDALLESPAWIYLPITETYTPGARLGPYEIGELLGRGGMGEVYKAHDTRLNRPVAIKVLYYSRDSERLIEEARAASALNHPHIVQIHEFESIDGRDFFVMEFLAGVTLAEVLSNARLTVAQVLDYASQIVSGLAAAHASRIVHRDIKPGNVMVGADGTLKLLDFGIARRIGTGGLEPAAVAGVDGAAASSVMGTASYMSPEQAQGGPVNARSDVFSTGAVIYEMLTGRRAFDGQSTSAIVQSVIRDQPVPIRILNPGVPRSLARIVERCLDKDPARRYASAVELAAQLDAVRRALYPAGLSLRTRLAIAGLLIVAIGVAAWQYVHYSRAQWVRNVAAREIRTLIGKGEYVLAFDLIRTAQKISPDDPLVLQSWAEIALPIRLQTTPPGAKVSYRRYGDASAPWRHLGVTPLPDVPVPGVAQVVVRIEKEGFETAELAVMPLHLQQADIPLYPRGSVPPGMVPIPQRSRWAGPGGGAPLPHFFLDRYEVRNRDYAKFVEAGGYRDRQHWRHPIRRNGREVPHEEALSGFRDATGDIGPATWVHGRFPQGQEDYPVAGISWFEAAAYCAFAGKRLPTADQWNKAAAQGLYADVLTFSNLGGQGLASAGSHQGISAFGNYDMAGNVKEWIFNEASGGRAIFGGAWNESPVVFSKKEAWDPWARLPTFGCRCALSPGVIPESSLAPLVPEFPGVTGQKSATDDVFAMFQRLYQYDALPLDARTDSVDDSNPVFRRELVSYRAAYENQRIPAYLYLPKTAKPPYQTVIWVPGGYAWNLKSSQASLRGELHSFLLNSGRAVLQPVYWGFYERRDPAANGPNAFRDLMFRFAKDAFRSIDYLASRSDIDTGKLVYFSVSNASGPIVSALDRRLKGAIYIGAGLSVGSDPPEVDPLHFAPRVKIPVLMINGSHDFLVSAEQRSALYDRLGSPPGKKRLVLFDTGHVPHVKNIEEEVLKWFDQEMGKAQR